MPCPFATDERIAGGDRLIFGEDESNKIRKRKCKENDIAVVSEDY